MFFANKPTICLFSGLVVLLASLGDFAVAQQSSRAEVLRQAQMRGQRTQGRFARNYQPSHERIAERNQLAQGSGSKNTNSSPILESAPLATGSPVVTNPQVVSGSPVVGAPAGSINAQPMQYGNVVSDGQIIENGSPIITDGYFEEGFASDVGYDTGCGSDGGNCCVGDSYFGGCGFGGCGHRSGGCGPACWQNCWVGCLAGLFSSAELFGGAHGFRSRNFTAGNQQVDDSSFGFYGGANLGLPLCRLSCGMFSGQVGVRSSQSEFEGDFFSSDNRDQLFFTAGFFRRVDYGLQLGAVIDYLYEEWFVETQVAQIRGEIGWVYPTGNGFGFRFAAGTEDDVTNGIINGNAFDNLFAEVIDNYRFYYRFSSNGCGYCDAIAGWSDDSHAILGLNFDSPINGCWAMQGGFTYFLPDDEGVDVRSSTRDAWNVFVGVSFRPQGLGWYGNYDRPMFDVADNGSLVFGRSGFGN